MDEAKKIAKMIDHSLLHPTMTDEDLREGLKVAKQYDVASVCIKPYAVKLAAEILEGTNIPVCTVIGFPHGSNTIEVKVFETKKAIEEGATEIDMVINIGKALQGDWNYIDSEIAAISAITKKHNAILKVIFETDYVTKNEDKIKLCELCSKNKVEYVKTSTGFGFAKGKDGKYSYVGATEDDLRLMRKHAAPEVGVKASGGLRTLEATRKAIELGATRIGATATAAIIGELLGEKPKASATQDSGY
ncbi:deoxyribose-phosphate aldolase [Flammeovirgaceae bacterium SG7u.111]|nr:deoxyribose-phosphate aldolase [Flammeovirgaceae bacterium SG7u.132]WPO36864.1 deoxyribose-phosphate aldolase [Flammeovirgaceae bacterium SG7u.111]